MAKARLIMLSGGVDSVYLLAQTLRETKDTVIAHHIHLVSWKDRHEAEADACRKIVDYCRENYRHFEYSESTVIRNGSHIGFDVMICAHEAGVAAVDFYQKNGYPLDSWTIGICEEDFEPGMLGAAGPSRLKHILATIEASCYPNPPPFYYRPPVIPKARIIGYLGEELTALCWACRTPVRTETGFETCNACKSCRHMNTAHEQIRQNAALRHR